MVMREAKTRSANAERLMVPGKVRGASMGFAEPHGHVGRQHRRCGLGRATAVLTR
jgi:hypothetical protein